VHGRYKRDFRGTFFEVGAIEQQLRWSHLSRRITNVHLPAFVDDPIKMECRINTVCAPGVSDLLKAQGTPPKMTIPPALAKSRRRSSTRLRSRFLSIIPAAITKMMDGLYSVMGMEAVAGI